MPGRMVVGPPRVSLSSSVFHDLPSVRSRVQKLCSCALAWSCTPSPCDSRPKLKVHHLAIASLRLRVKRSGVSLRTSSCAWAPPRSVWVAKPRSLGSKPGLIPHSGGVEGDVAAVLVEAEPPAPARERGGLRIDRHVRRVGPLVVALRGALQAQHGGAAARDGAAREPAGDDPVALRVEEDVSVDAAQEGAVHELGLEARRAQVPVGGRPQEADGARASRGRAARGPRSSS